MGNSTYLNEITSDYEKLRTNAHPSIFPSMFISLLQEELWKDFYAICSIEWKIPQTWWNFPFMCRRRNDLEIVVYWRDRLS